MNVKDNKNYPGNQQFQLGAGRKNLTKHNSWWAHPPYKNTGK